MRLNEIYLYGHVVGSRNPWFDELKVSYICPENVRDALKEHDGEDVTVYMNTPGGDVYAGISIRHMLERHNGEVHAVIDGIGASAGSLILMGADRISMHNDSTFMLHFPWTLAAGNSDDMRDVAERLETLNTLMMNAYKERFTGTDDMLRELLKNESELTAEDALKYGFCDELIGKQTDGIAAIANKEGDVHAEMDAPQAEDPVNKEKDPEDVPEEQTTTIEEALEQVQENNNPAPKEPPTDAREEPDTGEGRKSLLVSFVPKNEQRSLLAKFKKLEEKSV